MLSASLAIDSTPLDSLPPAPPAPPSPPEAPTPPAPPAPPAPRNLILRNDTILGVCEGIGQDLSIPPLLLRLAFVAGFFFAPLLTASIYAGLGLAVALVHWLVPLRTVPSIPAAPLAVHSPENDREPLALAA